MNSEADLVGPKLVGLEPWLARAIQMVIKCYCAGYRARKPQHTRAKREAVHSCVAETWPRTGLSFWLERVGPERNIHIYQILGLGADGLGARECAEDWSSGSIKQGIFQVSSPTCAKRRQDLAQLSASRHVPAGSGTAPYGFPFLRKWPAATGYRREKCSLFHRT